MRVWGRVKDELGNLTWVPVTTDANGFNDACHVTALAQCFKLNTGESPFYAADGIPALQSVKTQVPPDVFVARIQQRFSNPVPFFASLVISRTDKPITDAKQEPVPTYQVNVLTHQGSRFVFEVTPT